jgi:hypothetical protein
MCTVARVGAPTRITLDELDRLGWYSLKYFGSGPEPTPGHGRIVTIHTGFLSRARLVNDHGQTVARLNRKSRFWVV